MPDNKKIQQLICIFFMLLPSFVYSTHYGLNHHKIRLHRVEERTQKPMDKKK